MDLEEVVSEFSWELRNLQWPVEVLDQTPAFTEEYCRRCVLDSPQ
jgi:hypothetical protein